MAGSAGTSTNLGTLIGWYLCVWVRVTTRLVIGMTAETKIFNGKSTTDISKDKANKVVSFLRNSDR
ncbi:hypothetical protein CNQ82_00420 [Staphylococcus debuckii]|nr:hypothetical protein CNQ82_00420 [Staphylococcus debuckii]